MSFSNGTIANGVSQTFERTPATHIDDLPGSLPIAQVPEDVNILALGESKISLLSTLSRHDLADEAVWRDQMALTGRFGTFYSGDSVFEAWRVTTARNQPVNFALVPEVARIVRVGAKHEWVDVKFTFETTKSQPKLACSGFLSLSQSSDGQWKIWMIRTILEKMDGYGDVDSLKEVSESANSIGNTQNGLSNGVLNDNHNDIQHFDCIVIGGGQAGLGVGSRLQALDVSYLIVDNHPEVGDSWNSRYDSVKLHTAREYGHLPFWRTYDSSYPEFLTKQQVAAGHQEHVKKYGINIWSSTEMKSSSWSQDRKVWTCTLNRGGKEMTLTTHHLLFAMGAGSFVPQTPDIPGREQFEGATMHSADYKSASGWKGKRGLVIGTANTAHDVADDMLSAGLESVTMVQRGRTFVLPAEYYMKVTVPQYNDKIPTLLADKSGFSFPISIHRRIAKFFLDSMAQNDSERFDSLERAGFNVERYGDIIQIIYGRMGGHYMDVGVSAKIAQGLIKIKSGAAITHYTPDGLVFSDGTEIKADVIVFATGFTGNMREIAGTIVGPEVESQLEDFWELDGEGEIRGAFKNTGHPGVWYTGGAIGVSRYYSRFLAIQIKLELMGSSLPVYTVNSAKGPPTINRVV